jgi:hypothetical protein
MAPPFIFVTTHTINAGLLDEYEAQHGPFIDFVRENEPRLIDFQAFMDEDRTEVTFLFVFPDAEAADAHMQVAREKIGQGLEVTRTARLETYGTPGPVLGQVLRANAEAGVPVSIKGAWRGGFQRAAVAA